jgi:hypothetical protein
MKIASMEDPFPRGTVIGRQVTARPLSEAERFRKCPVCGGYVDMRDRVWVDEHQQTVAASGVRWIKLKWTRA